MTLEEVIELVRPKVKRLGLNTKEVEKAARQIHSTLAEDATTEDAEKAIDGVLPYLELAQSQANRVIEEARKKADRKKTEEKEEEGEEDTDSDEDAEKKKPAKKKAENSLETKLNEFMESINQRFAKLDKEESRKTYSKKMEERFKDIDPEFYQMAAEGREFKSDEEFEDFATKVTENWGKYSQKLANEGLSRMAKPKGGGNVKKEGEISKELQDRINERKAVKEVSAVKGLDNVQPNQV